MSSSVVMYIGLVFLKILLQRWHQGAQQPAQCTHGSSKRDQIHHPTPKYGNKPTNVRGYVHVYMYICIYIYTYIHICARTSICVDICNICINRYTHMHIHMHTRMYNPA